MKRIVETDGDLITNLLGENVLIFCCRFLYEGKLSAINGNFLELTGTRIVYDTGPHDKAKDWATVEPCWNDRWLIAISAIESMGQV